MLGGGRVKSSCTVVSDKPREMHQSHIVEDTDGHAEESGRCTVGSGVSGYLYADTGGRVLDWIHVLGKGMANSSKHCYIG